MHADHMPVRQCRPGSSFKDGVRMQMIQSVDFRESDRYMRKNRML
jgi:hypothetical protein